MLNKLRLPKGMPSIADLEKEITFSPQIKDIRRTTSFMAPMKCANCGGDKCEATTSAISRNILFIRCLICGSEW